MERLIYKEANGDLTCRSRDFDKVFPTLHAYEETGFTPDEIEQKLMNFISFLSEMTNGHMSKTNYTVEAMVSEANDCFERVCDECADREELDDFKKLGSIEHIRELIQAEKDRRLVVLPFTIGTTLYRVTTPYRQEPKVTEFIVTNFVMRGKKHELMVEVRVNGVPGTNVMKIKSFYRTREEAEEALSKGVIL